MRSLLVLLLVTPLAFAEKKWIPADPAVECAGVRDAALCAELLQMRDRDQIARYDVLNHPEDKALEEAVTRVDRENLARLEAILTKHGWPGNSLVGVKASGSAWTIIQHATLETQQKYLAMMKSAAEAGELDWPLMATLIDRVQVREGKPQTYGTQFHEVDGVLVPQPIEDEANVDARRKAVGMMPLAEYTALLRQTYEKQQK